MSEFQQNCTVLHDSQRPSYNTAMTGTAPLGPEDPGFEWYNSADDETPAAVNPSTASFPTNGAVSSKFGITEFNRSLQFARFQSNVQPPKRQAALNHAWIKNTKPGDNQQNKAVSSTPKSSMSHVAFS